MRYLPTSGALPLHTQSRCCPCLWRTQLRLPILLFLWYSSSLLTSLSTKAILHTFPYPITLAAVQQAIAAVCGWAGTRVPGRSRTSLLFDRRLHLATAPIAAVMVCSLIAYRWALMTASVSFIHTVKTLGPIFTIAFARLLLHEEATAARYASVAPVMLGVALTSITEAEFSMVGFLAVLTSTTAQALQSVGSKRLLRERDVGKAELFAMAALHALLMLLPLSLLLDAWRITRSPLPDAEVRRVLRWLLLNGLCSFVNQYTGLSVLDAMSTPLSHAIANVMKRATVITFAMIYQARPVTPLHLCGVALSVFGALGYQHLHLYTSAAGGGGGGRVDREPSSAHELVPLRASASGNDVRKAEGAGQHGDNGACSESTELRDSASSSSADPSPPGTPPNSRWRWPLIPRMSPWGTP
jgi:solute carrier family 35 protein E1